jgi:Ser/Thr protein kinase RdoA (MazF antagonist)
MDDFYKLTPKEQAERLTSLAHRALEHWDLSGAELVLVKHRENAVYRVESPGGRRHALRVHRAGYHSDAALRSEIQWTRALRESGIPTPPVVPTREGALFQTVADPGVPEPRQCDLSEWIEGRALGSIEGGLAGDPAALADCHRTLGTLAAKLHEHALRWTPPPGFTRHAWNEDGILGEQPLWGRFWELPLLTPEQRTLLQRARQRLRAELVDFGKGPDRYGLIHADFLPENLIVSEEGLALIDFDDAGYGWHLFELATSLFFQQETEHYDELLAAFVAGYRSVRALPDEHLALLPRFFLARGMTYLGWAHTRSETEAARALTPLLVDGMCARADRYLGS